MFFNGGVSLFFVIGVNGNLVYFSLVKKKLSFSDYMKSWMNKVVGKVVGGLVLLKLSLVIFDEFKVDIMFDMIVVLKIEENMVVIFVMINGIL